MPFKLWGRAHIWGVKKGKKVLWNYVYFSIIISPSHPFSLLPLLLLLVLLQSCKMSQIWQIYLCKFSWTEMICVKKLTFCNSVLLLPLLLLLLLPS